MGISELRRLDTQQLELADLHNALGRELVRVGAISKTDAALAQVVKRRCDTTLDRILRAEGLAREEDILKVHARRNSTRILSAEDLENADPLSVETDPRILLKHAVVPIRGADGRDVIATSDPSQLHVAAFNLPQKLAQARVVLAPHHAIQDKVANSNRSLLAEMAEARVPEIESCRSWGESFDRRLVFTCAVLGVLAILTLMFPTAVFSCFVAWAAFTLCVSATIKSAAFIASMKNDSTKAEIPPDDKQLPKISVLAPLFRETEIAHALIARLSALTYPKCLLDVILVLEEEDELTQKTLAGIDLPSWVRPVIVPDGTPRTKPRAMNYALDFCEGDIIGIFDAEDAPAPDQLTAIAQRFLTAPPDVVCLQGVLDYYNPKQNWLARCFTIEYATWFRSILPGMANLGFAIPLGGTTLFFRRDVLEELGGWDAHNVTEDADLGFRLARHSYRTEMVNTVTEEEANCRPWPWIKQRSRWLKGYMTTYLVHMRRPHLLYQQLGGWKFWGFQAHFISALSQFFLAPFLWSFWLVLFGLPHPLDAVVSRHVLVLFGTLFLLVEVLNIAIYMTSVAGPKHRHLLAWAPTMHFYTPLGAIAAYKALYEIVIKPFFWDKTKHGLSLKHVGEKQSGG